MMFIVRAANYLTRLYFATPKMWRWVYWLLPILYFVSPVDLLPDMIPGLGRVDDILLVLFAFWVLDRAKLFRDFFSQARAERVEGKEKEGKTDGQKESRIEEPAPPHQVLGLSENADNGEIKKAYHRLLSMYHPDKFSHLGQEFEEIARRKTQSIITAYQQLMK